MSQAGAAELRTHGLTPAQYQLMVALRRRENPLQHELGERLGVTKGNVSQMVSRLEEQGWVARVPRGAANEVQLTAGGRALVDRLLPAQQAFFREQFRPLGDIELAQLDTLLERLARDT
jgi:DNA-binding MarR family transcriptional regulator